MQQKDFHFDKPFELESGETIPDFHLAYTISKPIAAGSRIIWICHALTANAEPAVWWPGIVGKNKAIDPEKDTVICANIPGSCYGSSGPLDKKPQSAERWFHEFPILTNRDIVNAFIELQNGLGIANIDLLIGASLGGQHALEWSIKAPSKIKKLLLIATNAKHSPWGIAFNEAQRMAIAADSSFDESDPEAGIEGMKAARATALLGYRNYAAYAQSQSETSDIVDDFKAAKYQQYQGEKLAKRFNAYSYYLLTKAMDSHNIGRDRESIENALGMIQADTHVLGISSDILFPISESKQLQQGIKNAQLHIIDSDFGHDGFLLEDKKIGQIIQSILEDSKTFYEQKGIGLYGLGCVGQGFYDLASKRGQDIAQVVVKNINKDRNIKPNSISVDPQDIEENINIHTIIEVIDHSEDAFKIVEKALKKGQHVVSANKKMIAEHLPEILDILKNYNGHLRYEAAAAASIPIIQSLETIYAEQEIISFEGILNGSSNYILTKIIQEGCTYSQALAEAQKLGFAESDPSLDVGGFDARSKLVILILHAFGQLISPKDIITIGISGLDLDLVRFIKDKGWRIKAISSAKKTKEGNLQILNIPQIIPLNHPFSNVDFEYNAVKIETVESGTQVLTGKGAGSHPTGIAVYSDVKQLEKGQYYGYDKWKQGQSFLQDLDDSIWIVGSGLAAQKLNHWPWEKLEDVEVFAVKITLAELKKKAEAIVDDHISVFKVHEALLKPLIPSQKVVMKSS